MEGNKQEEENQLQKEKNQSDVDSPKDRNSTKHFVISPASKKICTTVSLFLPEYWSWIKEHKYEVISGFIVAVSAVYIAFWLAWWGEQRGLRRTTKQKLHLVYLEAQYNITDAKGILDGYGDPNSFGINLNRPNSMAASVALEDANILAFLPLHKVSLLRSYANAISTLNQSLQVHQGVLESLNYNDGIQEKQARQIVSKNAAAVCAGAHVLQEELKEYVDETFFDQGEAERIENRIKSIKRKALKGEVSLSKEN